jgi:hypothetical protein
VVEGRDPGRSAASVVVSIAAGALFLFIVGVATAPLAVTRRGG